MGREHAEGVGEAGRDNQEHDVGQGEGPVHVPRESGGLSTFLLSNIRGLLSQGGKSKTGFLFDQAIIHNALAVSVTESWLKPEVKDSELLVNFPGYTVYRSDRKNRKCGGVCVFLQEDLSAECIGTFDNGVCELLVLQIHSLKTVLAILYRPPDTRLAEFSPVLAELDKLLSELPTPSPNVVMMGDLNFPSNVMLWPRVDGQLVPAVHGHRAEVAEDGLQARLQAQRLCDLSLDHHMVQLVDQPTHGVEVLDLVFTSDQHLVSHIDMEPFPEFTDHKILSIKVNFMLGKKPVKEEMFLLDSGRRL